MIRFLCSIVLLLSGLPILAQTFPFATLQGAPVDTTNWFFAGDARLGDTSGDTITGQNEVILVGTQTFRSGAVFFRTPVNITSCQTWVAEYDYRIFEGTGADGLAFFFLNNPPRTFITGGGMGLPPRPLGLMVCVDQWQNCPVGSSGPVPKLQIRYGNGVNDYSECPIPAQPTATGLNFLRNSEYQRIKITYDFGNIDVYVNDNLLLSGFYQINFAGYFGFTASTGSRTDIHSVKNFTLYTFKPIIAAPNAGPDQVICSGDTVMLGENVSPNDPYTYRWFPTINLSDSLIANPLVTGINNTQSATSIRYFLTKDTTGSDQRCSYADEMLLTIRPKVTHLGPDRQVCSHSHTPFTFQPLQGATYSWSPTAGISNPTIHNPTLFIKNDSNTFQSFPYIVTGTDQFGCTDSDTINFVVTPKLTPDLSDKSFCPGENGLLGVPAQSGFTYIWRAENTSLLDNLINRFIANPLFTNTYTGTTAQQSWMALLTFSEQFNCLMGDTFLLTLNPTPSIQLVDTTICSGSMLTIGGTQTLPIRGVWSPGIGLVDSTALNPVFIGQTQYPSSSIFKYRFDFNDTLTTCRATDSIQIIVKPLPFIGSLRDTTICSNTGISIGFNAIDDMHSYSWSPSFGLNNVVVSNPIFFLDTTVNTQVKYLISANLNGCEKTDSVTISVLPRPISILPPKVSICSYLPAFLPQPANPEIRYVWQPSTYIQNDTASTAVVIWPHEAPVKDSITYSVQLTNRLTGCSSIDSVKVVIFPSYKPDAGLDTNVCAGQSITIGGNASFPINYSWSNTAFLNNSVIQNPTFTAPDTLLSAPLPITLSLLGSDAATGCFRRDTLVILILPKPQAPIISGADSLCISANSFVYRATIDAGQSINWQTDGTATVVTQAADSIQLQFNNPGESTLTYTITNSFGCESNKAEKQIQILPLPEVQLLAADSLVCLGSFDSKRYEVNSSVMGSLFNWSADGGTIVAGGNSGSVTVNWFSTTETRQLMVDAFTPFGCKGAPIFIKIKVDSARPHLIVSTFANAENNAIEVSGSLLNTFQTGELSVERLVANAEFSKVGSINTSGSFTEDFTQAVEAAPTYRLAYINACKQTLYSDAHTLNFLTATVVNDNKGISLSWSGYKGWKNTIPEYEILRFRDNALSAERIASNLTGYTFEYTDVKSAFEHCFIIQATQSYTGVQSNSNKVCINFNNPITVPNLVTMNADGINDVFFVDNLPLYPRTSLKILNRWGQEVFQSNDYQNNWPEPGSKLTNGTYFYQLKLQNGFIKKGWVQVVK